MGALSKMVIKFHHLFRYLLTMGTVLFGAIVPFVAVADKFNGKWSGSIHCVQPNSGEFSQNIDLQIQGDKVVVRNFIDTSRGNPAQYEGSIELEDGFFSKTGDIIVSGYANWNDGTNGDWSLRGKWGVAFITLSGNRGRTKCEGTISTVIASIEAVAGEIVIAKTDDGNDVGFLLLKPDRPKAAVVLFVGGRGYLGVSGGGKLQRQKGSFPIVNRESFTDRGLMVAIVDAPFGVGDLRRTYRMSEEHGQDIRAVIRELRKKEDVPIWLVGHSRGTYSAANGAVRLKGLVDGLILTSTVTRPREKYQSYGTHPRGVLSMDLTGVAVPVLVIANRTDSCLSTPASNAEELAKAFTAAPKISVKIFNGQPEPNPDYCKSDGQHHFYGFQSEVITTIADFIDANVK